MARQKRRNPVAPTPTFDTPIDPPARPSRVGGVELIVIALILVTAVNAWFARHTLNPDGVSYLDLSQRLSAGDWGAFVQGYWSPAYPALVTLVSAVAGHTPTILLDIAHLLNALALIGAILLLWWWGRRSGGSRFTFAALAALMLVSSGLPRIEAVTPDSLHLELMVWLGYELLVHRGARWVRTGLLLGAIFLVKTSAWPWLLLSVPLRLWSVRDPARRGDVLRSLPVTIALVLFWATPMSLKAGHPTLGSAGRLNYCWYIEVCDSRTPDVHQGGHVAYHEVAVDSTHSIIWAEFDAGRWTYEPWSDPTAWEAGVLTRNSSAPPLDELVAYWGRQAGRTFGLWLLPMLAGVLLPWSLLEWRPERRRWWTGEGRPVLGVALLAVAGIFQFILIHAEPRLLAPYGILLALAMLHGAPRSATRIDTILQRLAGGIGLLMVAWYCYDKVKEGIATDARLVQVIEAVASANAQLAARGLSAERVVVVGPAIPFEAAAFFSDSRIIAQLPPASASIFDRLSPDDQHALLTALFDGKAQVAVRTTPEGGVTFIMIPPRLTSTTP